MIKMMSKITSIISPRQNKFPLDCPFKLCPSRNNLLIIEKKSPMDKLYTKMYRIYNVILNKQHPVFYTHWKSGTSRIHQKEKKKLGMRGYSLNVRGLTLFHQKLSYSFPSARSTWVLVWKSPKPFDFSLNFFQLDGVFFIISTSPIESRTISKSQTMRETHLTM